jgi:transposase-like protein
MNEQEALVLAEELLSKLPPVKTESDLNTLSRALKKIAVEKALNAELEYHLEQENEPNSRNGYSSKTLQTSDGEFEITTPRDRKATFEPLLVKKGQRRFTSMDDKILTLFARGMTTRDIQSAFKEMYDAEISPALVSKVTEAVLDDILDWQQRPLSEIYPILYLDCIVVNVRQDKRIINKSVYIALAVNMEGKKELLGLWISEKEGSHFWLSVVTELKNRGVKEIFIACVDGLKGFADAIKAIFPNTKVQLCIVHLLRNSFRYVSTKDRKEVVVDLKGIYQALTAAEAERGLELFASKWDKKYPGVSAQWRRNWVNIVPFFDYPEDIRKVIYTTNAIESLNSVIRKAINNRKIFPDDNSVFKVVYLAIERASRKWSMPIRDWKLALNRFMLEKGEF